MIVTLKLVLRVPTLSSIVLASGPELFGNPKS